MDDMMAYFAVGVDGPGRAPRTGHPIRTFGLAHHGKKQAPCRRGLFFFFRRQQAAGGALMAKRKVRAPRQWLKKRPGSRTSRDSF